MQHESNDPRSSDRQQSAHPMARPLAPQRDAAVYPVERWLAQRLLQSLQSPFVRLVLWNGEEIRCSDARPKARVIMRRRGAFYRLLFNPTLYFGDDYAFGRLEVEGSLLELLKIADRANVGNQTRRDCSAYWSSNSLRRARTNVHHHYDITRDFYKLWLDDRLVYTCAYYPTEQATLEEAQIAKLDYVCRKLRIRAGDRVVEAGGGWGALAIHMAKEYGASVNSFNISGEQIRYARRLAEREGVAHQVQFVEDDYRNITGQFDVFVSVGMLEHVGRSHYRTLGRIIDRCLTSCGRGLIHSIGQNQPLRFSPWIRRRIFPGAYPPTLRQITSVLEPFGFSVLDVENLRLHYAKTLAHWLERFEQSTQQIRAMFGEQFLRMWRLYLTGSQGAFESGSLQLFQVVFARPTVNEVPWTRAHLYAENN